MKNRGEHSSPAALWCLLLVVTSGSVAMAQVAPVAPGAVQGHSRELQRHHETEEKLHTARDSRPAVEMARPAASAGMSAAAGAGPAFLLRQIVTDASEILAPEEIRKVCSRYEQSQVTIADLNQAVNELNRLYEQKGYITARAVLPPQQVREGVVRIRLVEGHVGKIVIKKNTRTRDSYFFNRLRLNAGSLIQVGQLQRDLTYFNATNDLKLHAVLEPGAAFATADVVLEVGGPDDAEVTTVFDNSGLKTIGRQRAGTTVRFNSLFGNRDPLAVGMLAADGTLGGFINYSVPLGSRGLRLGGGYDYNRIAIDAGPLAGVGLVGHSFDASTRLSAPLLVRSDTIVNTSLAAHLKKSDLESEGFPLTRTRVRSLEAATELQRFDQRGLWFAAGAINTGFHDLGGSHTFFRFNGALARALTVTRDVTATFRAAGQVNALGPLPPVEQIQIGGIATVRGYPEGRLIGDKGYSVSGELAFPLRVRGKALFGKWFSKRGKAVAFLDHGGVFDEPSYRSAQPRETALMSAGFGMNVSISRYVTGRVDVGFPLRDRAGISSVGVHYYVQTSYPISRWWRRTGER